MTNDKISAFAKLFKGSFDLILTPKDQKELYDLYLTTYKLSFTNPVVPINTIRCPIDHPDEYYDYETSECSYPLIVAPACWYGEECKLCDVAREEWIEQSKTEHFQNKLKKFNISVQWEKDVEKFAQKINKASEHGRIRKFLLGTYVRNENTGELEHSMFFKRFYSRYTSFSMEPISIST